MIDHHGDGDKTKRASRPTVYEWQSFHIEFWGADVWTTRPMLPQDKYTNPGAAQNAIRTIVMRLAENPDFHIQIYGESDALNFGRPAWTPSIGGIDVEAGRVNGQHRPTWDQILAFAQIAKSDLVEAGANPSRITLIRRASPSPFNSMGVRDLQNSSKGLSRNRRGSVSD